MTQSNGDCGIESLLILADSRRGPTERSASRERLQRFFDESADGPAWQDAFLAAGEVTPAAAAGDARHASATGATFGVTNGGSTAAVVEIGGGFTTVVAEIGDGGTSAVAENCSGSNTPDQSRASPLDASWIFLPDASDTEGALTQVVGQLSVERPHALVHLLLAEITTVERLHHLVETLWASAVAALASHVRKGCI